MDRSVFGLHLSVPRQGKLRMRTATAAITLAVLTGILMAPAHAAAAPQRPLRLYLQAASYHFDRSDYEFSNVTPGLGIETGDRIMAAAGAYRNSVRTLSLYAAVGYRPFGDTPIRPFAALGLVWGYHRGEPDADGTVVEGPPLAPIPVVGLDLAVTGVVAVRVKALYPVLSGGLVIKLF